MTTHKLFRYCIALIPILLLNALPASAASLTFTPRGGQLDGDPINDIATTPGNTISFDVSLNNAGLAGNLTEITYTHIFDRSELNRVNLLLDIPGVFSGNFAHFPSDRVSHLGSISPNFSNRIDLLQFTTLPGLVNDGVSDLSLVVVSAFANIGGARTNVTAQFAPQTVEVQPVQGAPEPGSFLLLGLGLGLLAAYKKFPLRFNAPQRGEADADMAHDARSDQI